MVVTLSRLRRNYTFRMFEQCKILPKLEWSITKSKGSSTGMPAENPLPFAFFSKLDKPVFLNFAKECRKIRLGSSQPCLIMGLKDCRGIKKQQPP